MATGIRRLASRRYTRILTAAAAAPLLFVAACSSQSGSDIPAYQSHEGGQAGTALDLTSQSYATTEEVLAAVAAAQQTQKLPDAAAQQLVALSQGAVQDGPENCFQKNETQAPVPDVTFGECTYGDPAGTKLLVLYGDSRAPMWAASLERVAAITGWQLRVFAKGGCPVVDLPLQNNETRAPNPECDTFRTAAIDNIRTLKPQLVVTASHAGHRLANGEWPDPSQWQQGWISTFKKLAQPGTKVAILGAIPNWDNNDAPCLAAHTEDIQACSTERSNAVSPYFDAERDAALAAGVQYVDTVPWVCAEKCEPVIADIVVYYNPYHFTKVYADYLSGAVADALKPAMA